MANCNHDDAVQKMFEARDRLSEAYTLWSVPEIARARERIVEAIYELTGICRKGGF